MKSIKHLVKSVSEFGIKNSPSILTGIGVTGVVGTAVLAVKATPTAMNILHNENILDDYGQINKPLDRKTAMKIVKATWKVYLPSAGLGAATIACIIGANSINLRRNAAIASIYALTEATLKEYQAKIIETIGDKKEKAVRDKISADKVANNPLTTNSVIITGKGDTLCYETISGRYFKSDIEKLRKIQNDINHALINDMWVTLNEVYDAIGLSHIGIGDELGWNVDKMLEFNFSSTLADDGTPCLVLDHEVFPSNRF
jgi:hypothetical protein